MGFLRAYPERESPLSPPATSPDPQPSATATPLPTHTPTELAATSATSLPIVFPASSPVEVEDVELVDWDEDSEDELQSAIDVEEAARPAVFTAEMDLKISAPHPEAFLAALIHAGSTETALIRPLHAGSEEGVSPAISPHPPPPPTRAGAAAAPKLKSVLVVPDRKPPSPVRHRKPVWRLLDSNSGFFNQQDGCPATGPSTLPSQGPWQPAKTRRRVHQEAAPLRSAMAKQEKARSAAREAFKRRLVGRCYRCFASDHLLAQCREPVRCWECLGVGHFARHCSARRKPISADLRARITFPPNNIHSRITFPPLAHQVPHQPPNQSSSQSAPNHQVPQQPSGASEYGPQTLQRPACGHTNIENRLRTHALVISAPPEGCRATVPDVAYALLGQLCVPGHDFKVTHYGPGLFLTEFGSPAERDSAMMRGFVEIGGAVFPIAPWCSAGGPTESSLWYHVKATWVRRGNHDDNSREPRPWEESQHVCQLFPGSSQSPPTYCQALMGKSKARNDELEDSGHELVWGRTMSHSPSRSVRERDILVHASDAWERRRSRSPPRQGHSSVASQEQLYHDPLAEEMAAFEPHREDRAFDPMVQESQGLRSPASFDKDVGRVESPVRRAVSRSSLTGIGVQLPADKVTLMDIATSVGSGMNLEQIDGAIGCEDVREQTKVLGVVEDDDTMDDGQGGCAAFCRGIFKEAAAPLLPRPQTLPRRGGRGRKRLMVATRSSSRLAARPSPVPVAQRAQRKLMRELQFMEDSARPLDAAATEYLDLYGQNLSDEAVDKIRTAARLGNKKLAEALAAVAAEMGAIEMDIP